MSSTLDRVIARLIATQVRLLACQARLSVATDSEALHDLRTATRRLRSLLRPLRGLPGIDRLEEAARALGSLTTPLRDQEVLASHLPHAPQPSESVYPGVAQSTELSQLLRLLDAIVPLLRTSASYGVGDKLDRTLKKSLGKQWRKLAKAMKDPGHDRHRLRLLIKRVRYGGEAYPEHDPVAKGLAKALKTAQGALGDWHDRVQWLHQADAQPALASYRPQWQTELHKAEGLADKALARLERAMAKR
ncbi:CHAD domain-containing protein [Pseudomonas sp. Marseille-Q5115]|uniref:CHAD domain-containing protein n=1 Tax=Pseudomonas sp. Marseille-Q5115 TaxID=2866593 RepID=UPI001CE48596|nr:CHAD domain-containing protein [Pseudomonas sp. Marseille-Q5115]